MLNKLHLKNFTAFKDAEFVFGRNLNVIIGENSVGKSHILKAAYTALAVNATGAKESGSSTPTKSHLQSAMAKKLRGVFKPDELGRLARRKQGSERCEVTYDFAHGPLNQGYAFNNRSKTEVEVLKAPTEWLEKAPVYLPTRELLTIYPGFVSLYETTHLPFEETWRDTCVWLGAPLAKGPREKKIRELLKPIEAAMGGEVLESEGRFYLKTKTGEMEMYLVAEGLRKLAMLARLIATGSLTEKGYLFWDEPEANLNPKIIKQVARTIVELAGGGIQVFIATHSLFLLREIEIILKSEKKNLDTRYFGLTAIDDGVQVAQSKTVDEIGAIAVLDEELMQSDRYLNTMEETGHANGN